MSNIGGDAAGGGLKRSATDIGIMLVKDVMTEGVLTVDIDETARDAVVAMLQANVGSVVVEREGTPTGICTETDILIAAARTEQALSDIPLAEAMTDDLVTGSVDMPLRKAIRVMNRHEVKKLPITIDFDVVGIVTISDVVRHHTAILDEAHRIEAGRSRWSDS